VSRDGTRSSVTTSPVQITGEELITFLRDAWLPKGATISIFSWEDGDYFDSLVLENGGCDEAAISFFKSFPLGMRLQSFDDLLGWIGKCDQYPVIESKNGNYRVQYDLHIWIGSLQIAYNPEKHWMLTRRHGVIGKLLKPVIPVPWMA